MKNLREILKNNRVLQVIFFFLLTLVFIFYLFGSLFVFKGAFKVEALSSFRQLVFMYILFASSISFTYLTFYFFDQLLSNNKSKIQILGVVLIALIVNVSVIYYM